MIRQIFALTLFILLLQGDMPSTAAQVNRQLVQESRQTSGKRTALVIGNGRYQSVSRLDNPVNDANNLAAALQLLGFEVIRGTDANLVQMRRLIREFGAKLEAGNGVGLFYYAGHGVEVRGKNFQMYQQTG